MKRLVTLLISFGLVLSSCIKFDEGSSSFSFNDYSAIVVNFPKGDSAQYLIRSLSNNIYYLPNNLPDSMQFHGLQVIFTGFSDGEFVPFEFTDTANNKEMTVLLASVDIYSIKRSQQNMVVQYGKSFGECTGYCISSMELKRGNLNYFYVGHDTTNYPLITCEKTISRDSTDMVLDYINKQVLYFMNSHYGCPDCDDSGAEWISVKHGNFYKKITFEYMNEPEELSRLLEILRRFEGYSDCSPQ